MSLCVCVCVQIFVKDLVEMLYLSEPIPTMTFVNSDRDVELYESLIDALRDFGDMVISPLSMDGLFYVIFFVTVFGHPNN